MRRSSKVFFVVLIGFAVILVATFVRDVFAWESCGDDVGPAVADTEMYGAPSAAECSIVRNQPTGLTPLPWLGAMSARTAGSGLLVDHPVICAAWALKSLESVKSRPMP
ncbi:hypothetical protein [Planotetraspora kaengkrachanensis]|uniref:Uncharacterized protein n=1 Tax=Planotetraspora kaengkrachanensis TaxID=575193 RepID=A0A8J3LRJ3_9ACTN|nr:hypothetical protein [Planotetraspora kaengkrachanensis]GIG77487.1 hypothetical protein Pka01_06140 [Planotetraspora kaengkrachanensis]